MYVVHPSVIDPASPSWIASFAVNLWSLILYSVETVMGWVDKLGPSISYILSALDSLRCFIVAHPHPFHILGWAIFFGPIILLLPCLLLLELTVLLGTYLTYFGHGFVHPPPPSCDEEDEDEDDLPTSPTSPFTYQPFPTLLQNTTEARESLFARVELWTAALNRWTTAFPALLVLRVFAGVGSACLFLGLVWGWW